MFKLGLTGSIGMGKSTTAQMFAEEGFPVWDADAAVHRLYAKGGAGVRPIGEVFPNVIVDSAVSREKLRQTVKDKADALAKIEQIVHPLVARDRETFLASASTDIVVLDIPLLFETGGQVAMDAVVCVSVSPEVQEKRVMARGTMTQDAFDQIRSKQMLNDKKCALSDFVIVTDTVDHARAQVQDVIRQIRERLRDA